MKVVHVSTSSSGGAALAAIRLAEGQRASGLDAEMVFLREGYVVSRNGRRRVSRTMRAGQRLATLSNFALMRDRNSFFSPLSNPVLTTEDLLDLKPNIVHVHNWYNLVSFEVLSELEALGIPVVITAHDERNLTGGCHYTLGCEGLWEGCPACPQSRLSGIAHRPATGLHRELSGLSGAIVAPSDWLARRLSARFSGGRPVVSHLPNCLNPAVFHPLDTPRSSEVVVGVMTGKATQLLAGALEVLAARLGEAQCRNVTFQVAGPMELPNWSGPVEHHGYLRTERDRADFWRSCDIAIAPTYADNFPNVNLEAIFSGAAPVTCDVGGAGEAIRATGRGYAVEAVPHAIAQAVIDLKEVLPDLRESAWAAWTTAGELYSFESVVPRFSSLYEAVTVRLGP